MTHLAPTHIHDSDPPSKTHLTANPTKWLAEHDAVLKEMVEEQRHSYAEIATALNARFGTTYSRNSVIGRANRLDISNKRPDQNVRPPKPNRPKLRIVRATGNSNNLKLIESIERDNITLIPAANGASLNLTLQELQPASCRYVTQDGPDWRFCGHDNQPGYSYCRSHKPLVWVPPTARNERMRGFK